MSRDDVRKTLGNWLGKAKTIGDPPAASEVTGALGRPERAPSRRSDALTQLNYKIPVWKKRHIKQLAVRDNLTMLAMLDEMVALYEREHGKIDTK